MGKTMRIAPRFHVREHRGIFFLSFGDWIYSAHLTWCAAVRRKLKAETI